MEWISTENLGYIAADVIRWTEPVFRSGRSSRSSRSKRFYIGDRRITAEVLKEPDERGWVLLLVRKSEALSAKEGEKIPLMTSGTRLKRSKKTISKGNPERLFWSDEMARHIVASVFLGNRD